MAAIYGWSIVNRHRKDFKTILVNTVWGRKKKKKRKILVQHVYIQGSIFRQDYKMGTHGLVAVCIKDCKFSVRYQK